MRNNRRRSGNGYQQNLRATTVATLSYLSNAMVPPSEITSTTQSSSSYKQNGIHDNHTHYSSPSSKKSQISSNQPTALLQAASPSQQKSLNTRLKRDKLLLDQLRSTLNKQRKSLDQGTFLAGGSIDTIFPSATLEEAARWISVKQLCQKHQAMLVFDGIEVQGILDEWALLHALAAGVDVKKCTVMQEMGIMPAMAQEGIDTLEALERMLETQSTVVPLLEGESFVGVVDMFTIIAGVINDHPVDNEEIFIDMISGNNHFLLLRDLITSASVADLINASPEPPTLVTINAKDSVHSLAELMFRERVSSALVLDTSTSTQMSGVVSTTDLTLRVMATGMDPKSTTVVRVMTPAPACVYPDSDCLTVLQRLIGKDDKKESTSSSLLSVREAVVPVINFDGSMVALLDLPAVVKMLMLCFKQMIMQDDKDNEFGEDYQIQLNDHELDEDETCLSSLISPSEQAEKNVVQKVLTKQFEIPTSQQSLAATCIIRVMVERDDGEYHHHLFEWSQEAKNLFWTELEAKIPNWACLVDQANHIKIINHCRWENSKTAKERCYDNPGAGQLDNSTNNGKNEDTIASYISVSPEEWIPNTPVTTFLVQVAKIVALSIDEKEPICFTVEPVSNSNQSIKSLSSPPFPVSPPSQSAPITNSFSETLLISLNSSIQTMPIATMNDEISNKVQIELSNSQSPSKGKKKSDVSNRNSGAGSFSSIGNGMPRRTPSSELTLLNEAGLAIDAKNKNASFFNSSSITSTIKSFFLPSVDYNSDNSSMVEEKGKVSAKTQSGGSAETKRYRLLMAGIGAAAGTALLATAIGLVYFMRSKNHQSQ